VKPRIVTSRPRTSTVGCAGSEPLIAAVPPPSSVIEFLLSEFAGMSWPVV